MARNLSWIDRRKLSQLLDDTSAAEEPEPDEAPRRVGLLDDDEPPPSRFEQRRSRFDAPAGARAAPVPPTPLTPPAARFDEDSVPAPPALFDDPLAAPASPGPNLPLDETELLEPAGDDRPDIDGLASALDGLSFESFATSGPSSFDLPPAEAEAAAIAAPIQAASTPTPARALGADAIVDDAVQFSPFDLAAAAAVVREPDDAADGSGSSAPATEDPEAAFAAAFESPPPPIEEIGMPSMADLPPPPIEEIGLSPPVEVTEETRSGDGDEFGPPVGYAEPYRPPPLPPEETPPPLVDEEPIELTCERFFDWALDQSGLDGAIVVDHDGLSVAERGFHELNAAFLLDALPLARGLHRYQGPSVAWHVALTHGRLHVVLLWSDLGARPFLAGLTGLAAPTGDLTELGTGFAGLFGGDR